MPIKSPRELFVTMLTQARQGTERTASAYGELSELAQNPEIQDALAARAFVLRQHLDKIDQAFKLIGETPASPTGRVHDAFVEESRKELAEIQSPEARRLFVLGRAIHLNQLRSAEYLTLLAAADLSGHYGVGVLLESCLVDHMAFAERTKRLIRNVVEIRAAARAAG